MESQPATQRTVRFGLFEADLQAGELRKKGRTIKLQEQPFEVLAMLQTPSLPSNSGAICACCGGIATADTTRPIRGNWRGRDESCGLVHLALGRLDSHSNICPHVSRLRWCEPHPSLCDDLQFLEMPRDMHDTAT